MGQYWACSNRTATEGINKINIKPEPKWGFHFFLWRHRAKGEQTDTSMGKEVYYSTLGVNGFLQLFIDLDCICRHFEYDHPPELHRFFIFQKK